MPIISPVLVPRAVQRNTTRSPSAAMSSMVIRRSGKAPRYRPTSCFWPAGPRPKSASLGAGCPSKSAVISSSTTARLPWFQTSSQYRRTMVLFCSVDMDSLPFECHGRFDLAWRGVEIVPRYCRVPRDTLCVRLLLRAALWQRWRAGRHGAARCSPMGRAEEECSGVYTEYSTSLYTFQLVDVKWLAISEE